MDSTSTSSLEGKFYDTVQRIWAGRDMRMESASDGSSRRDAQDEALIELGISRKFAEDKDWIKPEVKPRWSLTGPLVKNKELTQKNERLEEENAQLQAANDQLQQDNIWLRKQIQRLEQIAQRTPGSSFCLNPPVFEKTPHGDGDAEMSP